MQIRTAELSDAQAIADIYTPIVRETAISFESEPPSAAEMAGRMARTLESHPWLVAVGDGEILGYAYASQFRARAAYRWTCEVTAYVDTATRRGGVGRALYDRLLPILRRQHFHTAVAIVTLPNEASIGFHQSFGFEPAGIRQKYYENVEDAIVMWCHDIQSADYQRRLDELRQAEAS